MARKLSTKGLVRYQKYKEVLLTESGNKLALSIIRRHRLWETFLSEVLNLQPNEIHNEAEMLEHQTSDKLASKLEEHLGYPQFDPHGDPIPDPNGNLPDMDFYTLHQAEFNKTYRIARIQNISEELVTFFTNNGIALNNLILVEEYYDTEKLFSVIINDKKLLLDKHIAKFIFIKEIS